MAHVKSDLTIAASPIFYRLPAEELEEGMSTDDGQDIVCITYHEDDLVFAEVYTPRSDDPEQDAENRDQPETRVYSRGEDVDLAVFPDTEVDGSGHPAAVIMKGA